MKVNAESLSRPFRRTEAELIGDQCFSMLVQSPQQSNSRQLLVFPKLQLPGQQSKEVARKAVDTIAE
jgi:hypothetical protein